MTNFMRCDISIRDEEDKLIVGGHLEGASEAIMDFLESMMRGIKPYRPAVEDLP